MEQHAAGFQRLAGIDPLVQEMHAVVALAFGYEPVRLKFRRAEKVARCNRCSNLPDLTLIHVRGMTAAQVEGEGERAGMRPRKKVPVIRTLCEIPEPMPAFKARLEVELRAESGNLLSR
jgi:hypothetical protein